VVFLKNAIRNLIRRNPNHLFHRKKGQQQERLGNYLEYGGLKACGMTIHTSHISTPYFDLAVMREQSSGVKMTQLPSAKEPAELAQALFKSAFPNGSIILKTSASRFECALYALQISIQHQVLSLETPSISKLREIATTGCVAQRFREFEGREVDVNNFNAARIAATLALPPSAPPSSLCVSWFLARPNSCAIRSLPPWVPRPSFEPFGLAVAEGREGTASLKPESSISHSRFDALECLRQRSFL
jgi:hypothetical protein